MSDVAILLVDDEKTVLDSLKAQFRRSFGTSYLYETAENAAEAWEVVDELCADGIRLVAVVSDWMMPGVCGDEFLADVRRRLPNTVCILLTGHADERVIRWAHREGGVARVFRKPWRFADIQAEIESGMMR